MVVWVAVSGWFVDACAGGDKDGGLGSMLPLLESWEDVRTVRCSRTFEDARIAEVEGAPCICDAPLLFDT